MSQRRMFSIKIVDTDAFLDMPQSSQLLYFHLAMRADDDGFVSNPKKISRMAGCQDDDYKVLIAKRFIIPFENGVCVIKHWKIHNYIQNDRYVKTTYTEELAKLTTKKNNAYTLAKEPDVIEIKEIPPKLDSEEENQISKIIDVFYNSVNPTINYKNKTTRDAAKFLIKKFGFDATLRIAEYSCSVQGQKYAPTITTPHQLKEKLSALRLYKDREAEKPETAIAE